jgi:hypothetical protein
MEILFSIVYILFILGVALTSFFIVTNLQKYSINPGFTQPMVITYIIVTIFLVILNVALFVNIPFADFFYNTNLY